MGAKLNRNCNFKHSKRFHANNYENLKDMSGEMQTFKKCHLQTEQQKMNSDTIGNIKVKKIENAIKG